MYIQTGGDCLVRVRVYVFVSVCIYVMCVSVRTHACASLPLHSPQTLYTYACVYSCFRCCRGVRAPIPKSSYPLCMVAELW